MLEPIKLQIPDILEPIFSPCRFKVLHGGRGSGKSYSIAQAMIFKAHTEPGIRILCTREIQRSISDSVHRLIEDLINTLGLSDLFEVQNNYITHKNGSYFLFEGLHHNITKIKSMAGIKYCWVEEAEKISTKSWEVLIPTIREPDSEIWVSFNPDRDDDPTYNLFINQYRKDSLVIKVNHNDNPWFPDVLREEMELQKLTNYSKYLHIWEGEPITNYESLVYRFDRNINEVNEPFEYIPGVETLTGWDFGTADDTAICFMQLHKVPKSKEFPKGYMIAMFDEIINNNREAEEYREFVDNKNYEISDHYCDPSGNNRTLGLQSWVGKIGYNFVFTHEFGITESIDAANDMIHAVRINRHQCPKFYRMFLHWQYKTDKDDKVISPPRPVHDEESHPGTAFYYAMVNRFPPDYKVSYAEDEVLKFGRK